MISRVIFEGPVSTQLTAARRIRARSDVRTRQPCDIIDELPPLQRGRHIASVEQQITARPERCTPVTQRVGIRRQVALRQHYATGDDRSGASMRQDVDRIEIPVSGGASPMERIPPRSRATITARRPSRGWRRAASASCCQFWSAVSTMTTSRGAVSCESSRSSAYSVVASWTVRPVMVVSGPRCGPMASTVASGRSVDNVAAHA